MSNDTIFYTQIASAVAFLLTLFGIYRLLVGQKDSVIELLRERIADKDAEIHKLQSQTPDALVETLSSRVEGTLKEITRLREDGDRYKDEIAAREQELEALRVKLRDLSNLLRESDLVCRLCGAPLIQRQFYPIYGVVGGREVEAEGEYVEYDCGLALKDGSEVSPCKSASQGR